MIFGPLPKRSKHGGVELSKKAPLRKRVAGNVAIAIPLIFSSLERIDHISAAMELRRFGKHKQRTWLKAKPIQGKDLLAIAVVCLIVALGIVLDGP